MPTGWSCCTRAVSPCDGPPRSLFQQAEHLAGLGVAVPQMARVAALLNRRLGTDFDFLTVDEAQAALAVHLV